MTREQVIAKLRQAIVSKPSLANVPVILFRGRAISLREALELLEAGEDSELLEALENLGFVDEEEELVELAKEFFRRAPKDLVIGVLGRYGVLTPEQIVREIEEGTELGRKFVEHYRSFLLTIRSLLW